MTLLENILLLAAIAVVIFAVLYVTMVIPFAERVENKFILKNYYEIDGDLITNKVEDLIAHLEGADEKDEITIQKLLSKEISLIGDVNYRWNFEKQIWEDIINER